MQNATNVGSKKIGKHLRIDFVYNAAPLTDDLFFFLFIKIHPLILTFLKK